MTENEILELIEHRRADIADEEDRLEKIEGAVGNLTQVVEAARDALWHWDMTDDPITDCMELLRQALQGAGYSTLPRKQEREPF